MARQEHDSQKLCAAARALIYEHSQGIAKQHNLELDLICQILERDAVHLCEDVHTYKGLLPHTPEAVGSGGVLYCPNFFTALRYIPAHIAFNLFSGRLQPNDLRTLELFVDHYLAVPLTPLYTLEELEGLTAAFLDHLNRNRRPLVEVGLAEMAFAECPWLDDRFGRLYPTKLPAFVRRTQDAKGHHHLTYGWIAEPVRMIKTPDRESVGSPPSGLTMQMAAFSNVLRGTDVSLAVDGDTITPCRYDQAVTLPGFSVADVIRLEGGCRHKLLDLKISILRLLLGALRRREAFTLWRDCFEVILDTLPEEEFFFLLSLDRSYALWLTGHTKTALSRLAQAGAEEYSLDSLGGLHSLIEVIGHYEKEINIGTMDQMKRDLPPVHGDLSIYNLIWVSENTGPIDNLWSRYQQLRMKEHDHWRIFSERAEHSFRELRKPARVEVDVKGTVHRDYERALQHFAESLKYYAEKGGCIPQLLTPALPPPEGYESRIESPPSVMPQNSGSSQRSIFKQEGEYWTLAYKGKTVHIKDIKGLHYIAHLLRHPGVEFPVEILAHIVEADETSLVPESLRDIMETGLTVGGLGDSGEVLTPKTLENYRERLRELPRELEEAKSRNDFGEIERLQKEHDILLNEISNAVGLGGRERKAGDTSSRARTAVGNAIDRALKKIQRKHEALGRHLVNSLKGNTCRSYEPEEPIGWEL